MKLFKIAAMCSAVYIVAFTGYSIRVGVPRSPPPPTDRQRFEAALIEHARVIPLEKADKLPIAVPDPTPVVTEPVEPPAPPPAAPVQQAAAADPPPAAPHNPDLCERHHMHKVWINGRTWRCRK